MKKNKNKLTLNKETLTNLESNMIRGGGLQEGGIIERSGGTITRIRCNTEAKFYKGVYINGCPQHETKKCLANPRG